MYTPTPVPPLLSSGTREDANATQPVSLVPTPLRKGSKSPRHHQQSHRLRNRSRLPHAGSCTIRSKPPKSWAVSLGLLRRTSSDSGLKELGRIPGETITIKCRSAGGRDEGL